MKKLLLIATAAFMLANAYGQDTARNFLSVNAELQWKKTYAVETDFKTALLKVKEAGIFNSVDTIGNKIMMHINDFSMDAREAGYRIMKKPTADDSTYHSFYPGHAPGFLFVTCHQNIGITKKLVNCRAMSRGQCLFNELTDFSPVPAEKLIKGRSKFHIDRRNELLFDRLYYLKMVFPFDYDHVLGILSTELFLTEITIPQILEKPESQLYLRGLKLKQPCEADMRSKWPHIIWGKKELLAVYGMREKRA